MIIEGIEESLLNCLKDNCSMSCVWNVYFVILKMKLNKYGG